MPRVPTTVLVPTALLAALVTTTPATAGSDSETWDVDVTTAGQDVSWTSPTAVTPTAEAYDVAFTIQIIEVDVEFIGITFGPIDVTDQVPPDMLTIQETLVGPMPHVLADDAIVAPAPPEPTSVAFDLFVGFDGSGFGQADMTNVVLGTATVDLGFPLGVQTVDITELRVVGRVRADALPLCALTDFDGDGSVGFADLSQLLGAWGACLDPCAPDVDGDGVVGFADLSALLATWGPC